MMADDTSVIQMVARGTKLSLALYGFGAAVPSATADTSRLAKAVNLLSFVLRQVGASLKEYGTIPSYEAFDTVKEILLQCHIIFTEIENLVPAQISKENDSTPMAISRRQSWNWNHASRAQIEYLLGHLDGLKLTINVMTQTLYTVKVIAWSR